MVGHHVYLERVHDEVRAARGSDGAPAPPPGRRFLVDRLWPRGVSKEALEGVAWVREAAPSDELRRWFGHDPSRFAEFAERYRAELEARPEPLAPVLEAARGGPVTLLYAARDTEHNHAVVLREHLCEALATSAGGN
ncbi:uncharacterized protein YeaO (DUF488 family) [Nocardiopsis arvandica]|uniref:Uncharacterized protein YeaO (DUF488 family) n=1 Tax=Nocardiopsis sinuspersici TaxID=501010 RepID=A0A7Y9X7S0_9ACTN|nr:DUF488 family protein [Nocardiopsis sinuspersici]NYH50766.1 uncharacterized protein YeaO (DUF488 family) [Nocardiopsis sinuspersici]